MPTDLEIANLALGRLRANNITDVTATTDTSKAAQAVAREFTLTKQRMLLEAPWKVATETIEISVDATAPPEPWSGRYVLNTAQTAENHAVLSIRDVTTADGGVPVDYDRAADRVASAHVDVVYASSDEALNFKCTVEIDTGDLPAELVELFVCRLAEVLAIPLTGNEQKAAYWKIKGDEARETAFTKKLHESNRRRHFRPSRYHSALAARHGRHGRMIEGETP